MISLAELNIIHELYITLRSEVLQILGKMMKKSRENILHQEISSVKEYLTLQVNFLS